MTTGATTSNIWEIFDNQIPIQTSDHTHAMYVGIISNQKGNGIQHAHPPIRDTVSKRYIPYFIQRISAFVTIYTALLSPICLQSSKPQFRSPKTRTQVHGLNRPAGTTSLHREALQQKSSHCTLHVGQKDKRSSHDTEAPAGGDMRWNRTWPAGDGAEREGSSAQPAWRESARCRGEKSWRALAASRSRSATAKAQATGTNRKQKNIV